MTTPPVRWLPYEKEIVEELHRDDGLLVMGKGLGIHRLLACFARMYCSSRNLVLCLNANESVAMLHQLLVSLGLDRKFLPKAIDARSSAQERIQLYKNGGCFIITSRILVVDILNKVIDAKVHVCVFMVCLLRWLCILNAPCCVYGATA